MQPTKRNIIIFSIIAVALILIGIGISNFFRKPDEIRTPVDTSKYDKIVDSVKATIKINESIIQVQNIKIDSLYKKLNNKNQLIHETKQIKNFTPNSRIAWNDSVMGSIGLK